MGAIDSENVLGPQWNVQSFKDFSYKKVFIANLCKSRYAFACLQEARENKNQIRNFDGVLVCSSCGNKGNHGCILCINTRISWYSIGCRSVKFDRDNISIAHAEPRILVVSVMAKHFHTYIISAHAPYVGCKDDHGEWWSHFTCVLNSRCRAGVPKIIGVDANYQCHVNDIQAIGDLRIKNCAPPQS